MADRRIKAVATASSLPVLRATIMAAGDWHEIMAAAQTAWETFARTGRPAYVPFLADGQLDEWRENGKQFYLTDRNQELALLIWRSSPRPGRVSPASSASSTRSPSFIRHSTSG